MNKQKTEHSSIREDGMLDIVEIFDTIQGEGPYAGHPAVFIRLAGCNLQCPQCDTNYTTGREWMTAREILAKVSKLGVDRNSGLNLVVITGGEPFRQSNLRHLVSELLLEHYYVQIETNGTLYTPGPWHLVKIVCSPKTPRINDALKPYISAYKYVMDRCDVGSDGLPMWSLGHRTSLPIARPPAGLPIYLQPMDCGDSGANADNVRMCVQSCLKHGYILCLQTHKLIGVP